MAYAIDSTKVKKDYIYPCDATEGDTIISMNEKYAAVSGLTEAGNSNAPRYPFSYKHLRHIYYHASDNNKLHSRKIPCKRWSQTTPPPTNGSWDGLTTWTHGGVVGERIKL